MTDNAKDIRVTIEHLPNSSEWEYEVWIDGVTTYGYECYYLDASWAVGYLLEAAGVEI